MPVALLQSKCLAMDGVSLTSTSLGKGRINQQRQTTDNVEKCLHLRSATRTLCRLASDHEPHPF